MMKSIEDAAQERADKLARVVVAGTEIPCLIEDLNLWAKEDFKAGADFMQNKLSEEIEMVKSFISLLLINIDEFTSKDSMIRY